MQRVAPQQIPKDLTRLMGETINRAVPNAYKALNGDAEKLKEIFKQRVLQDPYQEKVLDWNRYSIDENSLLGKDIQFLHKLYNDPDSSGTSQINAKEELLTQFRTAMRAQYKTAKNIAIEHIKVLGPVPVSKAPPSLSVDLIKFDPPVKGALSDAEYAAQLQKAFDDEVQKECDDEPVLLEPMAVDHYVSPSAAPFPSPSKPAPAPSSRKELTLVEIKACERICRENYNTITKLLMGINFVTFLASVSGFPELSKLDILARWNVGRSQEAVSKFLEIMGAVENYNEFFTALEIHEVKTVLTLFNPVIGSSTKEVPCTSLPAPLFSLPPSIPQNWLSANQAALISELNRAFPGSNFTYNPTLDRIDGRYAGYRLNYPASQYTNRSAFVKSVNTDIAFMELNNQIDNGKVTKSYVYDLKSSDGSSFNVTIGMKVVNIELETTKIYDFATGIFDFERFETILRLNYPVQSSYKSAGASAHTQKLSFPHLKL